VVGIKQNERYDAAHLSLRNRDHALFIAFAPADNPRIVVAAMVENGGHGGSTAGPIARKVIDYWLLGKIPGAPVTPVEAPPDSELDGPAPIEEPLVAPADTAPPDVAPAGVVPNAD
jgi:penicillin-binding protein 2